MFFSMFCLSILCLFYILAFLCFVVLYFVIDPVELPVFGKEGSRTPVFKILVRALMGMGKYPAC